MRNRRGHWCWMCGRVLPNEKFSGRGHRDHICKKCAGKPKDVREKIKDELFVNSVLEQQNISEGNIVRLDAIAAKYTGHLSDCAKAVAAAARVHPFRKKRIGQLYGKHKHIFDQLVLCGLITDQITPLVDAQREEDAYLKMLDEIRGLPLFDKESYYGHSRDTMIISNYEDDELPF